VNYAVKGGADPNAFAGYPNLDKAERLNKAVDTSHGSIQLQLQQAMEKDNFDYATHKDVTTANMQKAQAFEEALFGEEGLLTLGLSMVGAGGLAGFVGLMRRKPGDWAPEDVDKALADAGVDSQIKGAQITEMVRGIEKFRTAASAEQWAGLAGFLKDAMSAGTKEAVAKERANL
jgi:hypothetical protein